MRAVVFAPGNPGSKMALAGAGEIWPPDPIDIAFGYQKIDKLLDPSVVATGIIDTVLLPCAPVYQPLENSLNDICAQLGALYLAFPYDWRKDINLSADLLAGAIQNLCANNPNVNDITLIGHSNGGLVARLLLEATHYSRAKWFGYITRLLCICTPHLGAPKALSICIRIEDDETIKRADLYRLCSDERYPAAYQLLPAPGITALWDVTSGTPKPLDFYQSAIAKEIGLDLKNLAIAKSTFSSLQLANRPKKVSYQFVVGTSLSTEFGVYISVDSGGDVTASPQSNDLGDGTVPIMSAEGMAAAYGIPMWESPGDHVGILATTAFQQWLYAYFGLVRSVHPLAPQPNVVISLNKRVYAPDERMSILIIPDEETEELTGTLKIQRVADIKAPQATTISYGADKEISYRGGRIPFIKFSMFAPTQPGAYQLSLNGSHRTHAGSNGWFAVSPSSHQGRVIGRRAPRWRR
jgi:hypothetical protein